jgi:hypothetical protein
MESPDSVHPFWSSSGALQLYKMFKSVIKVELLDAKKEITRNKRLTNKNQLKRELVKIKFNGNKFELLNNYTLDELLDKLKEVAELKFDKYYDAIEDIP